MGGEDRDNGPSDLVLDGKHVLQLSIVALGPTVSAGDGVDELRGDADAIASAANAAFEHVADAELAADLPDIDRLALVLKAELRAMTNSSENRDSSVMMSSVMPSLKYSCSGSPLRFVKGSTAIEGLSGSDSGVFLAAARRCGRWAIRRDRRARAAAMFLSCCRPKSLQVRSILPPNLVVDLARDADAARLSDRFQAVRRC